LLHHFGSKDGLLIALLHERDEQHQAAVLAQFGRPADDDASPDELRRRFLDSMTTIMARNADQPELLRAQVILRCETINPPHPAHAYFAAREAAMLELLRQAIAPFAAEPLSTARRVLGVLAGLEEQWLRDPQAFDLVTESRHAIAALLGLAG
jgi:AcrR family transcriptional regulator